MQKMLGVMVGLLVVGGTASAVGTADLWPGATWYVATTGEPLDLSSGWSTNASYKAGLARYHAKGVAVSPGDRVRLVLKAKGAARGRPASTSTEIGGRANGWGACWDSGSHVLRNARERKPWKSGSRTACI